MSTFGPERFESMGELRETTWIATPTDALSSFLVGAALQPAALATVRANIDMLVTEIDEVLRGVAESASTVRRYAEGNEALAAELSEEGAPALAAAKQRLWLVEESLAYRMDSVLQSLRERLAAEGASGGGVGGLLGGSKG